MNGYDNIERRASELMLFCDGAEDAGMAAYARRGRDVARDTLRLLRELEAERSARQAVQAQRDRYDKQATTYRTQLEQLRPKGHLEATA